MIVGSFAPTAGASERLFTYTNQTPVLQAGQVEIEPSFTSQIGRKSYYHRLDHRMELEWGLGKNIQTAVYLNFRAQAHDDGAAMVKETKFRGFSHEFKFALSDPVADPLGVGLYVEYGIQAHEYELEAKVLLDKAVGPVLLAFNAVGEVEIKPQAGGADPELEGKLIILFGTSFRLSDHVHLGFELRELNVFEHGEVELALLSAGPALSITGERAWFAATVLPQILDLKAATHHARRSPTDRPVGPVLRRRPSVRIGTRSGLLGVGSRRSRRGPLRRSRPDRLPGEKYGEDTGGHGRPICPTPGGNLPHCGGGGDAESPPHRLRR